MSDPFLSMISNTKKINTPETLLTKPEGPLGTIYVDTKTNRYFIGYFLGHATAVKTKPFLSVISCDRQFNKFKSYSGGNTTTVEDVSKMLGLDFELKRGTLHVEGGTVGGVAPQQYMGSIIPAFSIFFGRK